MLNLTPTVLPVVCASAALRLTLLLTVPLAILSATAVPSMARQIDTPGGMDKGATVQLQGCVVEGERRGSYVFKNVTAWPVMASPNGIYGPRHFWLDDARQLAEHIGRTVQVTGMITEVRESEVERNPGLSSKDGQRVAIELPTGDVFTSVELAGVGKAERGSRADMKITLLKVKVEKLLMLLPTCLPPPRGSRH
jgi:hypothetical protein